MSDVTGGFPRIERTEVDGVPVLWSDAPGQPTLALQFRVGRIDERPADAGITHVVEHLTMGPLGEPRYEHNAFVDPVRTVFFAMGTPVEVTAFADTVTRTLQAPPLDRLEREREVLKREAAGRETGIVEEHLRYRFGMRGHGLLAYPEFGLGTVSADLVGRWTTERYGRGNASAWMTAAPPPGLRFHLADGPALPMPAIEPEPTVRLPSHVPEGNGVGFGFVVTRARGAGTLVAILQRRLRHRLRLDRGVMYDVVGDYHPLDGRLAAGLVGGDCDPRHVREIVDAGFEELERLGAGAVTREELDDEVADMRRALTDPTATPGLLDAMLGMEPRGPEERFAEQSDTTAEDIAERAREARASLILFAETEQHPDDLTPYPMMSLETLPGREVKPLLSFFGLGPKHRLVVGADGVSIHHKDGLLSTVRYPDCVVAEVASDEDLILWGSDGARVWIPAAFWRGGQGLIEEVLGRVDPSVVVRDRISHDLVGDG
jgi:zinc protease